MVEGMPAGTRLDEDVRQQAPYVPGPRTSPENHGRSHRAPSLSELVAEAHLLIRRDDLPSSGFLVVQRKGSATHQHAVWMLGPFAILDDGWFGQVHGLDTSGDGSSRWLRRHERRCHEQHWTYFRWIDPASLEPGCGTIGIGLGLGPEGPTYCAGQGNRAAEHPAHIPLADILRGGLRALALSKRP